MANGIIRLDEGWRLDEGHRLDQPPNVPAPVTPPKKRRRSNTKSNTITIMSDYIPSKREPRRAWLQNISEKAAAQVVAGGGTAPVATSLTTAADALIAAYAETDSAKTTYEGKKAMETDTEATQLAVIRGIFTTLKVLPTWKSSGADAQLQSSSSSSQFDPSTYKPVFTVEMKGGLITLEFKKKGVDALAFYGRLRGTLGWTKLGVDTSSPYVDGRPLAVAGVAEAREYMARGMMDDDEIGLESDVVCLVFGG
ncbi:MAG: hypothetical protein ABL962_07225 [Fimbriimonadaceae bacterium]